MVRTFYITDSSLNECFECRYRAVIRKIHPKIEVFFVDYGNTEIVKSVKELPTHMYDIEKQAIPISISTDLETDQIFKIKCFKQVGI